MNRLYVRFLRRDRGVRLIPSRIGRCAGPAAVLRCGRAHCAVGLRSRLPRTGERLEIVLWLEQVAGSV